MPIGSDQEQRRFLSQQFSPPTASRGHRLGNLCLLVASAVAIIVASLALGQRPQPGSAPGTERGVVVQERPIVEIQPGQNIQMSVAAAPPGTSFLLKSGLHRMQAIQPKDGDTFRGEPGAVLSGARLLTTFTKVGDRWMASGQSQRGERDGVCARGFPRCDFPEDVYVDDQLLTHVNSLLEVGPGKWHFDYDSGRIYIGDDPTGRRIETSVTPAAFEATGNTVTNVTISDLTIEKYASKGNSGAIWAPNSLNWIIENNHIRWNHAAGIACGSGARIRRNNVHDNGQVGVGGYKAVDVLVENNELAHNNTAHFDPFWGAAGLKMVAATNLVVRGNLVHHNDGPGLWCDYDCMNTLFEDNKVDDNAQAGIFYEVSFTAIIRNNLIRRNGSRVREGPASAGILIAAAKDVSIYGNTLVENASGVIAFQENRGRSDIYKQPFSIDNLDVHDNSITMSSGVHGLIQHVTDTTYYTSRNNRFDRNRYHLGRDVKFMWMDAPRSESEWQRYGQDRNGVFSK
jgi:hypothetical protein